MVPLRPLSENSDGDRGGGDAASSLRLANGSDDNNASPRVVVQAHHRLQPPSMSPATPGSAGISDDPCQGPRRTEVSPSLDRGRTPGGVAPPQPSFVPGAYDQESSTAWRPPGDGHPGCTPKWMEAERATAINGASVSGGQVPHVTLKRPPSSSASSSSSPSSSPPSCSPPSSPPPKPLSFTGRKRPAIIAENSGQHLHQAGLQTLESTDKRPPIPPPPSQRLLGYEDDGNDGNDGNVQAQLQDGPPRSPPIDSGGAGDSPSRPPESQAQPNNFKQPPTRPEDPWSDKEYTATPQCPIVFDVEAKRRRMKATSTASTSNDDDREDNDKRSGEANTTDKQCPVIETTDKPPTRTLYECSRCPFKVYKASEMRIHVAIEHSSDSGGMSEDDTYNGDDGNDDCDVKYYNSTSESTSAENRSSGLRRIRPASTSDTSWPYFLSSDSAMSEKPRRLYPCPYKNCEYVATQGSNRKKHLANVHGENVIWYKCSELGCMYRSKQKGHLKNHHAKVHLHIFCTAKGCDFGTPFNSVLEQHYRDVHGYEYRDYQ